VRLVTGVAFVIGGVFGAACGAVLAFLAVALALAVLFEGMLGAIWSIVRMIW
jgi:hypothetical protein